MKIGIIGGGPAGSMLAHRLGKAGIDCTLFEKNGAWEKPCAGGVPPKVRDMLPEIEKFDGPRNSVALGEFIAPSGLSVTLESKRPMWVVSRKDFGAFLLRLAASHQSVTIKQETVRQVRHHKDNFLITADSEETFDFVVGADGCRSKLGPVTGCALPSNSITLCSGYFVEAKDLNRALSWMLPAPGYMWAFPRTDHICVGGGSADPNLSIKTYARQFIADKLAGHKVLSRWAAPIPFIRDSKFYDRPVCGKNWAVIGDAAGHVDALTGEGILYALLDGALLANAIIEGNPEQFEQSWRDTFGFHLIKATDLSAKYYNPQMMERAFRIASKSPAMREFLIYIMSEQPDYMEAAKTFSKMSFKIAWESIRGKS